jgi:hypothetical protein
VTQAEGVQVGRVFRDEGFRIEFAIDDILANLSRMGFPRLPTLENLVRRLLPSAEELSNPKAIGRILATNRLSPSEVRALPDPIRGSEYLLVAVCTAGADFDDEAAALRSKGILTEAMVLETIALGVLSQTARHFVAAAKDWARARGLHTSRAFLPGLGGRRWSLAHQRWIFAQVQAEEIGVKLTPSDLMAPTKSVSFVLGIGRETPQAEDPFSCAACSRRDCTFRHSEAEEMLYLTPASAEHPMTAVHRPGSKNRVQ